MANEGETTTWGERYFGFESLGAYLGALLQTPRRFMQRSWKRRCDEQSKELGDGELKRCLGPVDLVCFGIGIMLGAGVFITTGTVAQDYAGPAIIIAYAVAGLSALLSAFCYAEFSVDVPYAGGAYNFVLMSCGEFLAWFTVANLVFEYVLANAGVIRGFAPYFASLCNKPSDYFLVPWNGYNLDFFAFGLTLAITVLLIFGMKESSLFNLIITILHIILVVFIIIAGFTQADTANFTPFAPYGWRNIFSGASVVFFSYIGFDAVATTAEEAINPGKDMPTGIIGSMLTVTTLYILMAAVLQLMVSTENIDPLAPFTAAFKYHGMGWAQYIVALGALMGIVTGTLVGIMGSARVLAGAARDYLVFPVFAKVSEKVQTPWVATLFIGVCSAVISLFTAFDELLNLVSICTLFVFWQVAVALIWRRQFQANVTTPKQTVISAIFLTLIIGCSLGFVLYWNLDSDKWVGLVVLGGCAAAVSFAFWLWTRFESPSYVPTKFSVPWYPLLPCASVFLNTFLLGTLGQKDYEKFGIWTAVCFGIYILYSLHGSYQKDMLRALKRPDIEPVFTGPASAHGIKKQSWYGDLKRKSQLSQMSMAGSTTRGHLDDAKDVDDEEAPPGALSVRKRSAMGRQASAQAHPTTELSLQLNPTRSANQ